MNVIQKLSPHVADLIAAGEVVERPASVVKELLENSFDAGATQITVEIQRGGMGLMRVTDNGCGMSPEDAGTAFLRHATSKLRDEFGLEAIRTLGFRGEALAAVAAVSRVSLLTRERGAAEGTALSLEAGEEQTRAPAGCPEGSTIVVRDLFYNTPARLKFMRKDASEGASVTAAVIRCALSHPEVSIRYLREGKEEFQTAGDGRLDGAVYALLGRDFAKTMLPAQGSGDGMAVTGFICPPASARGNRSAQYFFVNGRYVKSPLLQAALEQAYRNVLFTGRFPACVLFLQMKHNAVDVNVHPAKTEVRFLQEKPVFDIVYRTVQAALQGERARPELRLGDPEPDAKPAPEPEKPVPPPPEASRSAAPAVEQGTRPASYTYAAPPPAREARTFVKPPADMPEIVEQLVLRQSGPTYNQPPAEAPELPVHALPVPEPGPEPPSPPEPEALPPYRILGEAFREYILVEAEGELVLIDKHAAHERMLFDRLKSQTAAPMSQTLLAPQVAELDPEDAQCLLENRALLDSLGLEAEAFGGGSLLVRRLPAGVDAADAAALLAETAAALRLGKRPGSLGQKDEALASFACKAAVKAGMDTQPQEWKPVVEAVLSGRVKYCPHGRPVTLRLTKKQIDRNFKRT